MWSMFLAFGDLSEAHEIIRAPRAFSDIDFIANPAQFTSKRCILLPRGQRRFIRSSASTGVLPHLRVAATRIWVHCARVLREKGNALGAEHAENYFGFHLNKRYALNCSAMAFAMPGYAIDAFTPPHCGAGANAFANGVVAVRYPVTFEWF